ncbi:hypothetical protein F5Y15DRAFT_11022 [Xylariaceae sp. FL0016]|nr:hypothetical protein F5Y15DRAFT_11022 [Xylariaceae sp. FL0016]
MATGPQAFYCLWQDSQIRETLFQHLSKEDICNVRLANSACCNLVTKRLFLRTHLTFSAASFTRQPRIQALSRIGHHIEHLTFYFPHSDATFLPPLIDPESGQEINFLYKPHTSMGSVLERPKFANSGLGEVLTAQYGPLFHAASNVPSFIHAMKHLPNVRHLTIKTPGQDPKERYRRDIVDYALISLRISMERAPMKRLTKLTLSSVHPSAFIYLRHTVGFGCLPSAGRRWKQIRKLHITAQSWDFYGPSPGLDHLKMIQDYICNFSTSLEKLTFTWLGRRGPCPVALAADPLFKPSRNSQKLFHEVTSPMSPLPPAPARKPAFFPKLRFLAVRNATLNVPQVADLVATHHHGVREFDFENSILINDGSWDEALAPLMNDESHSGYWTRYSTASTMEPPRFLPEYSPAAQESREDLPEDSAAVAAVSEELLHINLDGDDDNETEMESRHEEYEEYKEYEEYEEHDEHKEHEEREEPEESIIIELPSDVEAARKASVLFMDKLKKRRVTKRRRKRKPGHEHQSEQSDEHLERRHRHQPSKDSLDESPYEHRSHYQHRYKPSQDSLASRSTHQTSHSRQLSSESMYRHIEPPPLSSHPSMSHQGSRPRLFGEVESVRSMSSSQLLFGEVTPLRSSRSNLYTSGSEPELTYSPTGDESDGPMDDYFRPVTPKYEFMTPTTLTPATPKLTRSSTLTSWPSGLRSHSGSVRKAPSRQDSWTSSYPPTTPTRSPRTPTPPLQISAPILDTRPSMPTLLTLQPTVYDPTAALCSEISAVQRDLVAEEKYRLVAEDAEVQTSALRRAKELVLSRLGSTYSHASGHGHRGSGRSHERKEPSFLSSARFREGLFGKNSSVPSLQENRGSSMDVPILFSRG